MRNKLGFTLLETLISLGIFMIVATAIYFSYINVLGVVSTSALDLTTLSLIENEIEGIRNMAYEDVGIVGGWPVGRLEAQKIITVGDSPFNVRTTIRNVDDPFDGMIGGTPNDLAPADYKLIEIEISCDNCGQTVPAKMTTTVAPPNLENTTNNGALFINVFDASGNPVADANVTIRNILVTPNILINDTTNIDGLLQLVDIATSSFGYNIQVAKNGYSSERTYQPGDPVNPNPIKPHATVARQQVTGISFSIDRLSTLNFRTSDVFCQSVGNIDFLQTGTKLIGTDPDILKYSVIPSTNSGGNYTNNSLEWDTYNFQNLDPDYEISGTFNLTPLLVDPGTNQNFVWLVELKDPLAALITVRNQNGQLINDAKITLSKTGFGQSKLSGQTNIQFSDWSDGQYSDKSSFISTNNPVGSLTLSQIDGKYATSSDEWLISSTIDFGAGDTIFYNLEWLPMTQPPAAGPNSLKIQIASNNDNNNWNFIGPDGTSDSFYLTNDTAINAVHNNNRYVRYKVFLSTQDESVTPVLDDLTINFRSSCIPNGQAYFNKLSPGTYSILIEKSGYQPFTEPSFSVTRSWQEYRANIILQ